MQIPLRILPLREDLTMDTNAFWNLFCDTGDPICWLCYKKSARESCETTG